MPHIKAFSEKNKIKPNLLHFLFFYDTMFSNKEDGFSLFERERKIKTGEKKMGALEKAETLFLWFMIYSVVGWIYESILCSVAQKKFINRGFLNGPYCPIYGSGAVLVILVLGKLTNPFLLFFAGALLTCSLEYLTSFVMEKLFHARWWDYSKRKFNINGRVCLIGAVVFGAFSTVLVLWIHPLVTKLTDLTSCKTYRFRCSFLRNSYGPCVHGQGHGGIPREDRGSFRTCGTAEKGAGRKDTRFGSGRKTSRSQNGDKKEIYPATTQTYFRVPFAEIQEAAKQRNIAVSS